WDIDTEFEFVFDLGIAPEIDIKLSTKNKIPYYTIKVDNKLIDSYTENYTKRYGSYVRTEIVEGDEVLKGNLYELDNNGDVMENGTSATDGTISVSYIKDEDIKKQFIGTKVNDIITFNIKKAFLNTTEIAALLKIEKSVAEKINSDFQFTVNEISKFKNADINQEFFNKAFGESKV
ncbi:unnamed protein product, partial [marine sediment metagenome]